MTKFEALVEIVRAVPEEKRLVVAIIAVAIIGLPVLIYGGLALISILSRV